MPSPNSPHSLPSPNSPHSLASPILLAALWLAVTAVPGRAESIDFNRDVRPLISDRCFACHGFDEHARQADLRLDSWAGATADLGGHAAVVPGKPAESELVKRITATDPEALMPPADSHKKPLTASEIATLTEWIRQGAVWSEHWALVKPQKSPLDDDAPHPIDDFVRRRLREKGLRPAPPAAAYTLVRRLSFDLTGLPPTPEVVAAFQQDPSPAAWEKLIAQWLDSPHFGERMAMWWLDGARYSDTDGFQADATRTNWPWRDWVVDAFHNNMPFDQFTIEQFAGDLLPDATPEQRLATCFHRNHMNNGEGGRDPEESRIDYVRDRVNTTGTLWLGLTLGCAQCHDHKFDPVAQRDYYSVTAYFNSIDESGAAGSRAGPYLKYRSPYAQRAVAEAAALFQEAESGLAELRQQIEMDSNAWVASQIEQTRGGFTPWTAIHPARLAATEGYPLSLEADEIIQSGSATFPQDDFLITAAPTGLQRITGLQLEVFPHAAHTGGKLSFGNDGEFILTNVKLQVRSRGSSQLREVPLAGAVADTEGVGEDTKYGKVTGTLDDDPRTGWTTRTKPADVPHRAVFALQEPLVLDAGETLEIVLMQRSLAPRALIGRFRLSVTDQRGDAVRSLAAMPLEQLAAWQANNPTTSPTPAALDVPLRTRLVEQFLEDRDDWQRLKQRHARIRQQLEAAKKAAGELNVAILAERQEPRVTHVLERGVWDKKGGEVLPGVLPAVLRRDAASVPTRLDLAHWIVSPENPLTARVIVNQVWQLFFGAGLVRTPDDFGLQGESPTHPALLDWLAADFLESGWDLKHLVRTIVTSQTYQQDSTVDAVRLEQDPQNRLLARGARFRLPSWMIRDAALQASGMLNPAIGGPPVFPYQPPGVWADQFMGRFTYQPSLGPAQYRRTLYAFWRRSSAPTFLFDAAMRRTCEVTPRRTNTPLQALTLLNDTTALEAARTLADAAMRHAPGDFSQRCELLFLRVVARRPGEGELEILARDYQQALAFYQEHPADAATFVQVGQLSKPATAEQLPELAATMLLANLVLNLDESITHE